MNSRQVTTDSPVLLATGSGKRRIGNVVAEYFAKRGYRIALHYRTSEQEAQESRETLQQLGTECEIFQADISEESEVNQMVNQIKDRFGRIDVTVTTASIWSPTKWDEITADEIMNQFRVNTLGTFLTARAVGNVMVGQKEGGAIVTFGDWAIDRPYLDHIPYFISKGSIPTMTRALATELAEQNRKIRVNCIHPGPVMFPPGTTEEEAEELRQSTLLKDGDCPEMVAVAVEGFANNKFVTGTCLPVDGGRRIHCHSEKYRQ